MPGSPTDSHRPGGPLAGVRVVELAGLGPAPFCGQLLADMGAEVTLIDRPGPDNFLTHNRAKKSIVLDLRKEGGAEVVLKLVRDADILIEGLRPGVAERLGVGPEACHAVNKKLVYGRMTGWGQTGPWAKMAGHDINYISVTGALEAIGAGDQPPPPPLNLVGDYGGGSLYLLSGLLAALFNAARTGAGDVVDAAIIDGANSLMGIVHSLDHIGQWTPKRGANLLDGGAPFYRCYKAADDRFMAVGCLEPQFFSEMLRLADIPPEEYGKQHDFAKWPAQHAYLEKRFAEKTRDEWAEIFDGSDACVTPVLDYAEARAHKQNAARDSLIEAGEVVMPGVAPRFQSDESGPKTEVPKKGADTRAILAGAGYSDADIDRLIEGELVSAAD